MTSPLCLFSLNDHAGREPPVTPGPGQTAGNTWGAARLGFPSGVWAPSLLCFFIGKRGTVKPDLRTQGPHGAPSSGPGHHEDPACASFPVVIDRGARGLLLSIKWEKVTMVRK